MSFDITALITDRTNADVAAAQALADKIEAGTATEAETALWNLANLKGAYNHTDLNRVGAAMNYLAARLEEQGYDPQVTAKTDWQETNWHDPESMGKYLSDLETLRSQIAMLDTTPETPESTEKLTVEKANNIEKILEDLDRLLTNASRAWYYSGEIYAGEV